MKNKAFTLIELLAVIVILAIILAISVPGISKVINSAQVQAFAEDEKMLIKATKNYIGVNESYLPTNIGDKVEIKLSDLQNSKFIGTIKTPYGSNECNGYVLITKLDNNKYDYIPHLNCETNIGSSIEDKLVGHWTFDDFQESTQNMLANPLNFTWNAWPDVSTGWAVTKEQLPSDLDFDGKMCKLNITAGTTADWSSLQIFSNSNSIVAGNTYGFSFYAKAKVGRKLLITMIKNNTPWTTYVSGAVEINVTTEWQRFEITFTASYTANDARIQISTGYELWDDELYIYKPQFEKRSPTPFTADVRLGMVKDYSINNNHATLQLESSPKWVNDSKVGSGAYHFDGVNDYIKINHSDSLNLASDITISAWIKADTFDTTNFRIASTGLEDLPGDHYAYVDNTFIGQTPRSYQVIKLDSNFHFVERTTYDAYDSVTNADAMKDYLASLPDGTNVIITTYDEPVNNVVNNTLLIEQLVSCGATPSIVSNLAYRSSYILVGQKGLGAGNAFVEKYGLQYGTSIYYDSGDIIRKGRTVGIRLNNNNLMGMINLNYLSTPITQNKWIYVVQTYDGTTQKLYVDGKLISSSVVTVPIADEGFLWIGGAVGFNGYIDDVKIYSRILSESEIKLNYDVDNISD